jgi:ADP-ribose pyrophosphatase YjhB (NUDIX family)
MGKAARAIIIENGQLLVMHRNKYGSQYYTLVGGKLNEGESAEDGVVREVREETGLEVVRGRLVFYEQHPEPYNEQFIYLCEVAPHADVAIQSYAEEAMMNRLDANTHRPLWISAKAFENLPFRTPPLHDAIKHALKKGFPAQPVKL